MSRVTGIETEPLATRVEAAEPRAEIREDGHAIDLGRLSVALFLRRRSILIPTFIALIGSIAFVMLATPRYTGVAKVLLENQESYFTRPDKETTEPVQTLDEEAVQSQVESITTIDLARKAVDELQLAASSEFNPALSAGPFTFFLNLFSGVRPNSQSALDRVADSFLSRLTVFAVTKSRVLQIEFSSQDPSLAARGANVVSKLFLEQQQEAKQAEAKAAGEWLSNKIDELRARVAEAGAKVEAFRAQSGLLKGSTDLTVSAQQLAELNTRLAAARTAQAEANAKAETLQALIKEGRVGEVPEAAQDESLRRFLEQRVALKAEIALESKTLLPQHPRMKALAAELLGLEDAIREAAIKAVRGYQNAAREASIQVDDLTATLASQSKTVAAGNEDDVRLRELELDEKTARDQLESYVQKYREAMARDVDNSTPADARIIAVAAPPRAPTFPLKAPTVLLVTLAGFVLSTAVAATRVLLKEPGASAPTPGPRAEVAEAISSPPSSAQSVAAEPVSTALAEAASSPPERLPQQEDHRAGEIKRAERVADELAEIGRANAPMVVAVFGVKEARAADIALVIARRLSTLKRVVLLDLSGATGLIDAILEPGTAPEAGEAGLGELCEGQLGFAEALHRDRASDLDIVPRGAGNLEAEAVEGVVNALAGAYEFVVATAADWREPACDAVLSAAAVAAMVCAAGREEAAIAALKAADGAQDLAVIAFPLQAFDEAAARAA